MNRTLTFCLIYLSFFGLSAFAGKITTQELDYSWNDQSYKGFLAKPKKLKKDTPGILVVHEWWGHNDYAQKRAKMLAEEGYIALALDMYGEGKTAEHPGKAGQMSAKVSGDLVLMQKRFEAGMKILKSQMSVNKHKLAAMGYCFGGGVVLQMARQRQELKAVVSFHGSLATDKKVEGTEKMPKILVFHGSEDPLVSKEVLDNFKQEMTAAKADFKIVEFPGVSHAFTNPKANEYAKKFKIPLAYDAKADKASWTQTMRFFKELFANKKSETSKAPVVENKKLNTK